MPTYQLSNATTQTTPRTLHTFSPSKVNTFRDMKDAQTPPSHPSPNLSSTIGSASSFSIGSQMTKKNFTLLFATSPYELTTQLTLPATLITTFRHGSIVHTSPPHNLTCGYVRQSRVFASASPRTRGTSMSRESRQLLDFTNSSERNRPDSLLRFVVIYTFSQISYISTNAVL